METFVNVARCVAYDNFWNEARCLDSRFTPVSYEPPYLKLHKIIFTMALYVLLKDNRYSQRSELPEYADDFLNIRELAYFIYLEEHNFASLIQNYVGSF